MRGEEGGGGGAWVGGGGGERAPPGLPLSSDGDDTMGSGMSLSV